MNSGLLIVSATPTKNVKGVPSSSVDATTWTGREVQLENVPDSDGTGDDVRATVSCWL